MILERSAFERAPASSSTGRHLTLVAVCLIAALVGASCSSKPAPPPKQVVVWQSMGSWTGRGSTQTETFLSDSGVFRLRWRATNEAPRGGGTLRVAVHSSVSGRTIDEPVDHASVGDGIEYVNDTPHAFYLSIDSKDLDWTITVEESVVETVPEGSPANTASR